MQRYYQELVSGRLVSQAPKITISIPSSDSGSTFSLLNSTPRKVPTIGVKYVGIIARTVPVRFSSVPNSKNAMPEPSAPNTTVAPNNAKVNLVVRNAHNPKGADRTVEIETTLSIKVAGV